MKGLGILEVNGREYVVLDINNCPVNTCLLQSGYFIENSQSFFVARRFSVEGVKLLNGENVVFKTDQFLTPRWMTIHGNYTINWFPEPMEVDVEDTWVKQEEK